jgi:MoxR-like ATPase
VHDALKRRCLYQWLEYPSFEKELAIVRVRVPEASAQLAAQVTALSQELRTRDLYKVPGVSETIDWVSALLALGHDRVDEQAVGDTLGVVLKAREDVDAMRGGVSELLARAAARATGGA